MATQIIDLSALYWRNWHASDGDEVSSARRKTLGFVRSLYGSGDVIVALDSPPYKRKDVYPEYKANRPERNEAAIEELKRCTKEILDDGWKVASAPGYEADDVIYTIYKNMPPSDGRDVVYGTDKDLLQCCDIVEPWSGKTKTAENTLRVSREKVVDYLTLIGDSSDNVPGVRGVGPKTACALLDSFGSIKGIYDARLSDPGKFKPKTIEALDEATGWIDMSRELIQLQDCSDTLVIEQNERGKTQMELDNEKQQTPVDAEYEEQPVTPNQGTSIVKHVQLEALSYERSLEPSSLDEAFKVACAMHESRFFEKKFRTPDALLTIVLAGREVGLGAFAAANSIDNIQGTLQMKASLMVGLVQSKKECEYLYCEESTNESCTWVTKRLSNPSEQRVTVTYGNLEQAGITKAYNKKTDNVETKDNYRKQPDVMVMWRCAAKLCRRVYSDLLFGLYANEEME